MKSSLPAPTDKDLRRFQIIKEEIGCLIHHGTPADAHHCLDPATGNRISHQATVPLCADVCHWLRHNRKVRFQLKFGDDEALLIHTNKLVDKFEDSITGGPAQIETEQARGRGPLI